MIRRRALLAALALLIASPAFPAGLSAPTGRVLLTVSGAVAATNAAEAAEFDREMLEALDWQEIETHTHYTEGPQRFAGPTLASLLHALGVTDGTLRAVALDDYAIEIPVSDLESHDILLALEHNGAAMRVRDRGPIWVIYPAPTPEDIGARHVSHSIWQLKSITVEP